MEHRWSNLRRATPVLTLCVLLGVTLLLGTGSTAFADPGTLTVKVDQPGVKINPAFYGLMTEEINHSYDGGLYAELIQNRVFQDTYPGPPRSRNATTTSAPATVATSYPSTPPHWSVIASDGASGAITIDTKDPVNTRALGHSLRLDVTKIAKGERVGVANDGYWGIPVTPNTTYTASFYAKSSANFDIPLTIDIESNDGSAVYATTTIPHVGLQWQKYVITLKTGDVAPSADNRFVISSSNKGSVWFSLVSLFPPTYHSRANGNRVDLMEKLSAMHPSFLRFPGGNYLEGNTIAERFAWKDTIGPLEDRPGHPCPWGYRSSDGLGLLEFLEWCEDLKIQPVLAVYAGYSLRGEKALGPALQPFVQDALDEIEYVTGDSSTVWGQRRAQDGHPDPFPLTYVEIGNEDNLEGRRGGSENTYTERFTAFYDAIRARYPNLKLISTMVSSNSQIKLARRPDLIDDHYYFSAVRDALRASHTYDRYDRSRPGIFVGEWATRQPRAGSGEPPSSRRPTCNLAAALGDAAFLTGLERNADVIAMNCYAPLFVNVGPGAMQWEVNLIGYDALSSFGSPSYYVQQMFAGNRGDVALPAEIHLTAANAPAASEPTPAEASAQGTPRFGNRPVDQFFAVANRVESSGDIILKAVNTLPQPQPMQINLDGASQVAKEASLDVLTGDPADVNSINEPERIVPKHTTIDNAAASFVHEFPANSVSVIRLKTR